MKKVKKVKIGTCVLYRGDCRRLLDYPEGDCVLTDPPWGGSYNCDYTRFSNGLAKHKNFGKHIAGDTVPFNPAPWLHYPKVLLWGYPHFSNRLPIGTVLVWCKKRSSKTGKFMSDCELAWMNFGKGVYLFHHVWDGFDRESERGKTLHPMQKPVELMLWCLNRMKLNPGDVVLDPYMGSAPVALACIRGGYRYVGCEIDPSYFDIACARIEQATLEVKHERRTTQDSPGPIL